MLSYHQSALAYSKAQLIYAYCTAQPIKKVNELYAKVFGELYGMETLGLRYFNVFGRRQDPDGQYAAVIPRFVKALINHEAPVIFGDGSQTRSFCYVDDLVEGIYRLLHFDYHYPVNLGNPDEIEAKAHAVANQGKAG